MKRAAIAIALLLVLPLSAGAWGEKGHLLINRLAMDAAGPNLPDFIGASREHIIYNGPEPDRWRAEGRTSAMNIAQAPDHFFDSELWGAISTLEPQRYSFMEKVAAKRVELAKIGYLPYAIIENYEKLRNAFRTWRNAKTPKDRKSAGQNAVYLASVLGHYVGDGSMPMHLSIQYNGWLDSSPNPKGYTKDRGFHNRYESLYVDAAIEASAVRPKVRRPQRLGAVWKSVKQYLTVGFSELEPAYELEKAGEFNPQQPRPEGTEFIANELARASTMLGDLWYAAWLESGETAP
jgi:hypothetical protein